MTVNEYEDVFLGFVRLYPVLFSIFQLKGITGQMS